jgi:hypothetical protein
MPKKLEELLLSMFKSFSAMYRINNKTCGVEKLSINISESKKEVFYISKTSEF